MKKIIFGLCVSLLLATSASAATKEEKARELLALEDIQATLNATINRATIPLTCRLVLTQQEEEKLKEDFMKIGNFQGLINSMIPFFTENYTEAELDLI